MASPIQEPFRYSPLRARIGQTLMRSLGPNNVQRIKLLYRGLRYARIMDYIPIDGWLAHGEAITLYETARKLPADRPVVAEIGSWLGKSSVVIARGLAGKRQPRLYCIDPFNADGDAASTDDYAHRQQHLHVTLMEQFLHNVRSRGLGEIIHPLAGYSQDVIRSFHERLDLLFIDGNHEYAAVRRDFLDWAPLLKPGGYLAFHDVSFNNVDTGPQRVIREQILDQPGWTEATHVQSLFVVRKAGAPK